jgi:RND family efflux transporter MFP subunit
MVKCSTKYAVVCSIFLFSFFLIVPGGIVSGEETEKPKGPPPVPVKIAVVEEKTVSDQISLIGTAEAIARSTVAAEVSGIVESFPIREGDFIQKGDIIAKLTSAYLELRLKAAEAKREQTRANLLFSEKEYERTKKLKTTNSIAEKNYDEAFYNYQALSQGLLVSEAEIDQLAYEIARKTVISPFAGFVAAEHTQVGEYINPGGPVATLLDLRQIQVAVDVPERYSVMIAPGSRVKVIIGSVSEEFMPGRLYAILPQGDPNSRTFPVRINLPNPGYKIRSGMEATVYFDLAGSKNALLVPKDAVVTAGNNRLVFAVFQGKAVPVNVKVLGYYDGNVAIEGNLHPGTQVVTRGNERLMPGQSVQPVD